jgi:GT2 family glycosyltransferase
VRSFEQLPPSSSAVLDPRPRVEGKFLFAGGEKLLIRGVTYGAFRPDENGQEFHDAQRIDSDFKQMAANGINAVRIPHTTPPRSLLDIAHRHGLRVMVGLSAEQYVGFLMDGKRAPDVEDALRAKVRSCAGHPALLCYALGNEIPASIVRWLGRARVERYLRRLYRAVKAEDPDGLVTYVNYPTTEYLQLPFLDLVCFNVYLETEDRFAAYLARLQNIAGDRPLMMSELGLDAYRNGEAAQATALDWQVRTSFAAGCSGVFVFSWTDEWFRAGEHVHDWAFGVTDGERNPKPALAAVREAFRDGATSADRSWPRISVVVCSYNGGRTIRECCEGLARLEYPDFEVIVVDDGSTDDTAAIANEFGYRVISTENQGLSRARNTGLAASTGEIVAYLDDDAYPDPHWLTYLAVSFSQNGHVGIGGPNVTPPDDGLVAECVANAPGNPTHVLLTDEEAEHLPGCNMAFRREALEAVGGFDAQFRVAGDDVDLCWRLRERGWTLGFSPAAMVWHHRRSSVRAYLKQQLGYGKAEGFLQSKWPERHNTFGYWNWHGAIYGSGITRPLPLLPPLVYHGTWGSAPFQSIYERAPNTILALPLMPEWYLIILVLLGLSALGFLWSPMLVAWPLLVLAVGALVGQALTSASHASYPGNLSRPERLRRLGLTALLHLAQPVVRLWGRVKADPRSIGKAEVSGIRWPWARTRKVWTETWREPEKRLESLERALQERGVFVLRGGHFDRWDLDARGGLLASVRLRMVVEDHGAGNQLVRLRMWPKVVGLGLSLGVVLAGLAGWAALDRSWAAAAILASVASGLGLLAITECAVAAASCVRAVEQSEALE